MRICAVAGLRERGFMKKICLILENGEKFPGVAIGAEKETIGEVVFTTGMSGYIETLTDPSFFGQIVVQTFPLIGDYGVMKEDFESDRPHLSGYVVRDLCDTPSNFRSQGKLDDMLKEYGVPGICGVDTRKLTRIVREYGVMNGAIVEGEPTAELMERIKAYRQIDAVANVSCKEPYHVKQGKPRFKVTMIDYGAKRNIARELAARGCDVTVVPHDTSAEKILAGKPDGIMLSNGPGDPADNKFEIEQLVKLQKSGIPMFGICLGHQLLALANGMKSFKLKYGHRGENQPVKDVETGRVYITSQNHGYALDSDTVPKGAKVSFYNVNDGTCEGVEYEGGNFTVQFHPEACGGPLDTRFMFDKFIAAMEGKR